MSSAGIIRQSCCRRNDLKNRNINALITIKETPYKTCGVSFLLSYNVNNALYPLYRFIELFAAIITKMESEPLIYACFLWPIRTLIIFLSSVLRFPHEAHEPYSSLHCVTYLQDFQMPAASILWMSSSILAAADAFAFTCGTMGFAVSY